MKVTIYKGVPNVSIKINIFQTQYKRGPHDFQKKTEFLSKEICVCGGLHDFWHQT